MEPSVHFDKSKQKTCDSIPIGIFQISMPSFHYKYFEMQLPRVVLLWVTFHVIFSKNNVR